MGIIRKRRARRTGRITAFEAWEATNSEPTWIIVAILNIIVKMVTDTSLRRKASKAARREGSSKWRKVTSLAKDITGAEEASGIAIGRSPHAQSREENTVSSAILVQTQQVAVMVYKILAISVDTENQKPKNKKGGWRPGHHWPEWRSYKEFDYLRW